MGGEIVGVVGDDVIFCGLQKKDGEYGSAVQAGTPMAVNGGKTR